MYFFDNKKHNKSHIHAEFGEHAAIFSVPNGELLAGSLPTRKQKMVQAWIAIHEDELIADWKLAVEGKEIFRIDPLK